MSLNQCRSTVWNPVYRSINAAALSEWVKKSFDPSSRFRSCDWFSNFTPATESSMMLLKAYYAGFVVFFICKHASLSLFLSLIPRSNNKSVDNWRPMNETEQSATSPASVTSGVQRLCRYRHHHALLVDHRRWLRWRIILYQSIHWFLGKSCKLYLLDVCK